MHKMWIMLWMMLCPPLLPLTNPTYALLAPPATCLGFISAIGLNFEAPIRRSCLNRSRYLLNGPKRKTSNERVPIAGLGWSSPVVVDNKVYLTTAIPQGSGLSLVAMALDSSTGKPIWEERLRSVDSVPSIHSKNSHASPTPIVA